jgi:hypothetical protein
MRDNHDSGLLVKEKSETPSEFLWGVDEIGAAIGRNGRQAFHLLNRVKAVYRSLTRHTRRRASRSIPVYVRHSELLWSAVNGGVA